MSYIVLLGRILFSASFLAAVPMSGILTLAGGLSVLIGYQTRVGGLAAGRVPHRDHGRVGSAITDDRAGCPDRDRSASRRGRPGPRSRAKLRGGRTLARYHLLPSARADLLERLGRHVEARRGFERATTCASAHAC